MSVDVEMTRALIEALRSGKYKQTRGTLADETGMCCLGVLCDIWIDDVDWEWQPHLQAWALGGVYFKMPPQSLAGLLPASPSVYSSMNDTGSSFEEIADRMEADLNRYLEGEGGGNE